MSYDEWMKQTRRGPLKPRSKQLRVIDACLREYDAHRGSLPHLEALWDALVVWMESKTDWRSSVRNQNGAVDRLSDQIIDFYQKHQPAAHLVPKGHLEAIRGGAALLRAGRLKPSISVKIPLGVKDTSRGTVIYEGFTHEELVKAKQAWADAWRCAQLAVQGVQQVHTSTEETERFLRWFGSPDTPGVVQKVTSDLQKMNQAFNSSQVTLVLREDITVHLVDQNDPFGEMEEGFSGADVYGYVWHHQGTKTGYRVILGQWFLGDPDPIEGAAQTVYHELTHKVLGTRDHAYGKIKCRGFALKEQPKATSNADNFGFYAISFIKQI